MYLEGNPFRELENIQQGNGLEALRVIMVRYEPRTIQSKRAYLNNIMFTWHAKRVDDMGAMIQGLGRNDTGYEGEDAPYAPEVDIWGGATDSYELDRWSGMHAQGRVGGEGGYSHSGGKVKGITSGMGKNQGGQKGGKKGNRTGATKGKGKGKRERLSFLGSATSAGKGAAPRTGARIESPHEDPQKGEGMREGIPPYPDCGREPRTGQPRSGES